MILDPLLTQQFTEFVFNNPPAQESEVRSSMHVLEKPMS